MSEPIPAYPLCWPAHRPRTRWPERSDFETTLGKAIKDIQDEVGRLGGRNLIISSNLRLRLDGIPYASSPQPADKGVAVYFSLEKKPMCFACDRWNKVEDNMRAIVKTIDALRGIKRWGSGDMVSQAFTGFVALPAPRAWWQVLGFTSPQVAASEIEAAHRRLISKHHPDKGGDTEIAADINAARDQGLQAIR